MLLEELAQKNGGKKLTKTKPCCHTDHLGAAEYNAAPSFMPFGIGASVPGLETYDDSDGYYRHVGGDIDRTPLITRTVRALLDRRSEK